MQSAADAVSEMTGRRTEAIDAFAELVGQGFQVLDVTSTDTHVSIRFGRGRERETLTFDEDQAGQLLYSGVLDRPATTGRARTSEDTLDTFRGLLRDGFSVTDVASEDDRLTVTLRRGRDRETLTFDVDGSRFLAWGLLGSTDKTDVGDRSDVRPVSQGMEPDARPSTNGHAGDGGPPAATDPEVEVQTDPRTA